MVLRATVRGDKDQFYLADRGGDLRGGAGATAGRPRAPPGGPAPTPAAARCRGRPSSSSSPGRPSWRPFAPPGRTPDLSIESRQRLQATARGPLAAAFPLRGGPPPSRTGPRREQGAPARVVPPGARGGGGRTAPGREVRPGQADGHARAAGEKLRSGGGRPWGAGGPRGRGDGPAPRGLPAAGRPRRQAGSVFRDGSGAGGGDKEWAEDQRRQWEQKCQGWCIRFGFAVASLKGHLEAVRADVIAPWEEALRKKTRLKWPCGTAPGEVPVCPRGKRSTAAGRPPPSTCCASPTWVPASRSRPPWPCCISRKYWRRTGRPGDEVRKRGLSRGLAGYPGALLARAALPADRLGSMLSCGCLIPRDLMKHALLVLAGALAGGALATCSAGGSPPRASTD